MDHAVESALAVAARFGLSSDDPSILHAASNVLVHLRPYPVVARVPVSVATTRGSDAIAWLAREAAAIHHLAGRQAVAPADGVPVGPHRHGAAFVLLTGLLQHHGRPPRAPDVIGRSLRRLHEDLADLPGELPELGVLAETGGWLERLHGTDLVSPSEVEALLKVYGEVLEAIASRDWHSRPLHGDAHLGNLLDTTEGPVWVDFEDVHRGPAEWDLASLVAGPRVLGRTGHGSAADLLDRAVAAYGVDPRSEALDLMVRARTLAAASWALLVESDQAGRTRARRRVDWLLGGTPDGG